MPFDAQLKDGGICFLLMSCLFLVFVSTFSCSGGSILSTAYSQPDTCNHFYKASWCKKDKQVGEHVCVLALEVLLSERNTLKLLDLRLEHRYLVVSLVRGLCKV